MLMKKAHSTLSMVSAETYHVSRSMADSLVCAWKSLELSLETLSSISRLGFIQPTAIQRAAVPEITQGHDVIGKAPTGSGKTLAFGIPIYEYFQRLRRNISGFTLQKPEHCPIALIISPTRELAHQLSTHMVDLSSDVGSPTPSIVTVTGGLSIVKQQRQLATADVIIGTPGRLWEVFDGSPLSKSLKKIKFLIIDEADRLLSDGHFEQMEDILSLLDKTAATEAQDEGDVVETDWRLQRQTLVFSATFQKDLQQRLAGKDTSISSGVVGKQESMEYLLKKLNFREAKPKFIDVNPGSQMASRLKEGIVECGGTEKVYQLFQYNQVECKLRI